MAKWDVDLAQVLNRPELKGQVITVEAPDTASDDHITRLALSSMQAQQAGGAVPSLSAGQPGALPPPPRTPLERLPSEGPSPEILHGLIGQAGEAARPYTGPAGPQAASALQFLMPRTTGEMVSMVGLPGAASLPKLGQRLLAGAGVGAAGAAVDQPSVSSVASGAVGGATLAQVGNAGARLVNNLASAAFTKRIRRVENPEVLANMLRAEGVILPGPATPEAIKKAVQMSNLKDIAQERLGSQYDLLGQVGGSLRIQSGAIQEFRSLLGHHKPGADYTVREALDWFSKIGPEAFSVEGRAISSRSGRGFREVRKAAEEEIGRGLEAIDMAAGRPSSLKPLFDQAREDYAALRSIQRTFTEVFVQEGGKDVFLPRGGIDLGPVQRRFDKVAAEEGFTASKARMEAVQARLRRGATSTASDEPGAFDIRLGGRPGQPPFAAAGTSRFAFPQFVGRPPATTPSRVGMGAELATRPLRRGFVPLEHEE